MAYHFWRSEKPLGSSVAKSHNFVSYIINEMSHPKNIGFEMKVILSLRGKYD